MNVYERFADRAEAAEALALRLRDYRGSNPLILAIPRGAVPMAKIIAERLRGELDVVLAHKLAAPFDAEYAIGAIDETGWTWLAPQAEQLGVDFPPIKKEKTRQLEALKKRRALYTPNREAADPQGRIVIVVDDGMATGATMIAALHAVGAKQPAELICAVPVASPEAIDNVTPFADRVVCLHTPENFFGLSQFYRHFPPVEDSEVIKILALGGGHVRDADA